MGEPLFFTAPISTAGSVLSLPEDTARHVTGVLRMKAGDTLRLTDGSGTDARAIILETAKKNCTVKITASSRIERANSFGIAISPLKNTSRFEWFLEKATELGIGAIYPIRCARTEKQYFRAERFRNILISAMLQSQQVWLPELHEPVDLNSFIEGGKNGIYASRYIAHCYDSEKTSFASQLSSAELPGLILIGPEGDFTEAEVELATTNGYVAVSLGHTRLRTETAGMVAASLLSARGFTGV